MKQILILGAGLVARPAVRYLLEKGGVQVILADQAVEKAEAIIDGHANGRAVHLDVEDANRWAGTSRQPTLWSASCRGPCTRALPRFA
jgi:saccharopine dehydrogenase-like NADP-dependent oxidoreductase